MWLPKRGRQQPCLPLQDAVGNRVTLTLKAGGNLRIALPFRPTHALPNQALDALSTALEPSAWHALLSSHLLSPGAANTARQ